MDIEKQTCKSVLSSWCRIYSKKTNDIDASGNVKFGDFGVYILFAYGTYQIWWDY
jgi:hypothetical protein